MTAANQPIHPCLWFDDRAEEAVAFYCSIFDDSKVLRTTRYVEGVENPSGRPAGSVLTIDFRLRGQQFTALNGGPHFRFNEAISLVVDCENQAEVDRYWELLREGGDPKSQQCGWLKDKFGVSWQIVPRGVDELISDSDPARARRATEALLKMKKLDIAALRKAAAA
ncbi:MAG: VOC family protein [Deltaproteobacteria bacterium]|nr:VOC family protein [Nannocystaceae bacterium]